MGLGNLGIKVQVKEEKTQDGPEPSLSTKAKKYKGMSETAQQRQLNAKICWFPLSYRKFEAELRRRKRFDQEEAREGEERKN